MAKRRWKSASRAGNWLYWECPFHCGNWPRVELPIKESFDVLCSCTGRYRVIQLGDITSTTARILVEFPNET